MQQKKERRQSAMMPVNIFSLSSNAQSILNSAVASAAINRGGSKTPVKMKLVDMN